MRGILVLLAVVLVAGCSSTAPPPMEAAPVLQDRHLREVRMTSGLALGYVQPETASQILCQLLDREGWERLLDSEIGREPMASLAAGCQIATETGMVSMELRPIWEAFGADTTVAGRPATIETPYGDPVFTVALSDDVLQDPVRSYYPVRRLLELTVEGEGQRDVGTRVLTKIVPMLMADGEALPAIDDRGRVDFVPTPVTDPFVDLPMPVQALQLCTLLLDERPGERDISVSDVGQCEFGSGADHVVIAAKHSDDHNGYPDRVAGRPATTPDEPRLVTVLLQDDAHVEIWVSAADPKAVAEKLVPSLVG